MHASGNTSTSISLPESSLALVRVLEDAGFEAWVVGGFVRDSLLGRPVHDLDVATNAHWQDVVSVCEAAGLHTFETGTAHGTVTVRVQGSSIEVTTYRTEGAYDDARHPNSVTFVDSIEADLARRDFTINALAYHPRRGLCDPFGGVTDLDAGLIRAVGNPKERFSEDALRILRAVRFASELGFRIDDATSTAANTYANQLARISVERIAAELTRLLCGQDACRVLTAFPAVLDSVLPELAPMRGFDQKSPYHIYDIYEHTAHVVAGVPAEARLRWAALLHDCGKPDCFTVDAKGQGHFFGHAAKSETIARRILRRLHMPNALVHDVCLLVLEHDRHQPASEKTAKRLLARMEGREDLARWLLALRRADSYAHTPGFQERAANADRMETCLDAVLEHSQAFSVKGLAINGTDLIELGVQPGPEIGMLLDQALDAVIEEELPNTREALLGYVQHLAQNVDTL